MFLNYYHRYRYHNTLRPMNLLLEENAALDNIPEELSTLMTVLQI